MKRIRFIGLLLLAPVLLQASNIPSSDSLQQILDTVQGKARVQLLIKLSEQNRNRSVYDCKQYYERAFLYAKKNNYTRLMGRSDKSMGVSCFYWGDMRDAFRYFKAGLHYFRLGGDKEGQSDCLNDMGLIYENWANFDSAAFYYKASYNIEKELGNVEGKATSLINLGNIYFYHKDYHNALTNYYKALKNFVRIKDQNGISMAYNSLAIIYTQIGDFNKALGYLEKAKDIYSKTEDKRKLARVLNNMADIYSGHLKEYRKAEILYNNVLNIKEDLGDKEGIALVKCNLGIMNSQMDNLRQALKYFDESQAMYLKTGDKSGLSMVFQNRGKTFQSAGMYHKALKEFQKSLAISKETGLKSFTISNYLGLLKCYAALGEYHNFNKYFNLYERSKDTLALKLEQIKISKLEAKYKKISQPAQMKNRTTNPDKATTGSSSILLLFGLVLAFIVLILMLFLYRKAKKEVSKYKIEK